MPTYILSLFLILRGGSSKLERIQRNYLWGGGRLEKKPHLVKWSMVCLSKEKGGFEIHNLSNLNSALLGKWNWRFAMEENACWRRFIFLKYGAGEMVL